MFFLERGCRVYFNTWPVHWGEGGFGHLYVEVPDEEALKFLEDDLEGLMDVSYHGTDAAGFESRGRGKEINKDNIEEIITYGRSDFDFWDRIKGEK